MILGLGIDIVEIERIRKIYDVHGIKFIKKIFSKNEITNFSLINNHQLKISRIASRFAAKEAAIKSIPSKIKFNFLDFEIIKSSTGKPTLRLTETSFPKVRKIKGFEKAKFDLSLSHEKKFAIAIVTLSKEK